MNEIKVALIKIGECGFVTIGWLMALCGFKRKHWASGNPADVLQKYMEDNFPKEDIPYDKLKEMRDYCNEEISFDGVTPFDRAKQMAYFRCDLNKPYYYPDSE